MGLFQSCNMLLEDKPENENPFQEPHPGVATSVRVEQSLRFHEAEDIASIHSMSEEQEEEEEEEPLAPLLTHNTGPPLLSPLVIDDHTPEDSEGSALSDPRFSAFLIQSPYYRPEIKTLPLVEEEGDFEKEKEMEHLDDLYAAIKNGDLLVFNSVVEGMDESSFASIRFYNSLTPLHVAVIHNQIELVKCIGRRGNFIDEKDALGRTPLEWAIVDKNVELESLIRGLTEESCPLLTQDIEVKKKTSLSRRLSKYTNKVLARSYAKLYTK